MDHDAAAPSPAPHPSRPRLPEGFDPSSMFGALTDFRFTRFITVNIVQVLYVLGVALIALYTFAGVIAIFRASVGFGVLALLFSPVIFLLSVLMLRVYLELIVVIFRIAESTRAAAEALSKR